MNEKNNLCLIIALFVITMFASFGAGYWFGSRPVVQSAGTTGDEFGKQLEDKQKRIDELEAELDDLGGLVSDGFRNVIGIVDRVSGQIDAVLQQGGDIRATVGLIREAVKELENSERYFRGLADSIPDRQRDSDNNK